MEGQRERETENPKQALCWQCRTWHWAWTHESLRSWSEPKPSVRHLTNWATQEPLYPLFVYCYFLDKFLCQLFYFPLFHMGILVCVVSGIRFWKAIITYPVLNKFWAGSYVKMKGWHCSLREWLQVNTAGYWYSRIQKYLYKLANPWEFPLCWVGARGMGKTGTENGDWWLGSRS